MLHYFIQGFLLGFPTSAQPGPFQAYLLSQSVKKGWKKTLPSALAPLLSDGPIIILILVLLKNLPSSFLSIIRLAGALFLVYLAFGAFKVFLHGDAAEQDGEDKSGLGKAILINMFGPGPWIFWSTIGGPILLTALNSSIILGVAFLLGFYFAMIGMFSLYILLFGQLGRLGERTSKLLSLVSAVILLGFAIYLVVQVLV